MKLVDFCVRRTKKIFLRVFLWTWTHASQSRRRRVYHQNEVLYITKAKALYIIKPQENTRWRVMRYKGGSPPLMISTALPWWYTKPAVWIKKVVSYRYDFFGGDDGNWTRVQKPLNITFSVGSQSIKIPTSERRVTGSPQGSFLMHDRYKSNSRFTCTTDLTHGESRSPLSRYGRHYKPRRSLRCHCNFIVVVYYLSLDILTRLSGALRLSYFTTPVETIADPLGKLPY